MDSQRSSERENSQRLPKRRQFLGTLSAAVAIGVAGCSGSTGTGDGDGANTNDPSDGDNPDDGIDGATANEPTDGDDPGSGGDESSGESAVDNSCTTLTEGYTSYPGGERPLFSDFEIPAVLADVTEVMPGEGQFWVRAVRPLTADGDAQFHLSIIQMNDGQESARGLLEVEEVVSEIDYDGEPRPVSKMSRTDLPGVEQLRVELPYVSGDGTRYYPFTVQLEVENARDGEVNEACDAAIDEAALHVMESLQPNPDTTFG